MTMLEVGFLALLVTAFWWSTRRSSRSTPTLPMPRPPKQASPAEVKPPILNEEASIEDAAELLQSPPGKPVASEVQALLDDADRLFDEGKIALAERRYLKAASSDPHSVHALNRLGIIYLDETHEYADALEAFQAAFKLDPENSYLAHNLGLALFKTNHYTEAACYFELSLEGGSKNALRYANLGVCYLTLRQYGRAVSALRRAVALEPGNAEMKELLDEAKQKDEQHKTLTKRIGK